MIVSTAERPVPSFYRGGPIFQDEEIAFLSSAFHLGVGLSDVPYGKRFKTLSLSNTLVPLHADQKETIMMTGFFVFRSGREQEEAIFQIILPYRLGNGVLYSDTTEETNNEKQGSVL